MPVEFKRELKSHGQSDWVVVNMPQGLGRYGVEDAADPFKGIDKDKLADNIPSAKFEWYLKNHLGSTMLVYGTSAYDDSDFSGYKGGVQAAYDYRAFGEQVTLSEPTDKVTENFTGKEKDDETELNYFGARYLDPMLGLWTSVDPKRQFSSPYLYVGNFANPINGFDSDGLAWEYAQNTGRLTHIDDETGARTFKTFGYAGKGLGRNNSNWDNIPGKVDAGPLPAGKYTIGPLIKDYITTEGHKLPFTMRLIPDAETEMYGRSGMLIHANNKKNDASQGCVILDMATRIEIGKSGDQTLLVVPNAIEDMDPDSFGSGNVYPGEPILEDE